MRKPIKVSKPVADIVKAEARCNLDHVRSELVALKPKGEFCLATYEDDDSRALAQHIIEEVSECARRETLAELGLADPYDAISAANGLYDDSVEQCEYDGRLLQFLTAAEFADAVLAESKDGVIVVAPMQFDTIKRLSWFSVGFRRKTGDDCILRFANHDEKIRDNFIEMLKVARPNVVIREPGLGSVTRIIAALRGIPDPAWVRSLSQR